MPPKGKYRFAFVSSRVFTMRINSSIPRSIETDTTSYTFTCLRLDLADLDLRKLNGGADATGSSGDRGGADGAGGSSGNTSRDGGGADDPIAGTSGDTSRDGGGADTVDNIK